MKYIKELDSLRALAVLIVIMHHWKPGRLTVFSHVLDGVAIFFVLSGFLITGILISYREKIEKSEIEIRTAFKTFFIRRSLRIFPLYYFVLLFLYFTGQQPQGWIYYLTYTSNFYIYEVQEWSNFTHLWSLAVEEQFYFIWPCFILLFSRKYCFYIILGAVIIGLISPFFIVPHNEFKYILTPTCFFALGVGAFLSWLINYKFSFINRYYKQIALTGIISIFLLTIRILMDLESLLEIRFLTSVFTFWVIIYILKNLQKENFVLTYILRNRYLVFIGKISYGLYVFHNIIPLYTLDLLNTLNNYLPSNFLFSKNALLFIENFIILLIVSYLSWHLIETPFLKLKQYFRIEERNLKPVSI